ncbi:hypothetical protein DH2020_044895 [Rehmannia glutinosa]|uniref:MLO-like protein n=1 Tax=Rehmannia glutinosa TaxID=99300 RepID=A0ABR0UGE9_REHGL
MIREGRSLEVTPTWSVATVTTVMVFVCLFVERSIYRFGKWLKKTKRKALFASLEKLKEELMLLGLISLLLGQWARWISQICVNSSLFSSKFYICSEKDYGEKKRMLLNSSNGTDIPPRGISYVPSHVCGEGREPFVSAEGLEQLHRFLFVLGITHVLYSCIVVGVSMSKIYSWRKWEIQAGVVAEANAQGLNIYFWLSFIPVILVMLVGTKLQHVVSLLALEIAEPRGPSVGTSQVKPRDDLFWFGKPVILLRLIQFISFQNAFEMATFIWSLWGLEQRSCFMKNHAMITIRLISGVLVQFWCSYSTVPLNVIVTTDHDVGNHKISCSLDERDEIITVASGTLSPCSSTGSLSHLDANGLPNGDRDPECGLESFSQNPQQSTIEVPFLVSLNGNIRSRNRNARKHPPLRYLVIVQKFWSDWSTLPFTTFPTHEEHAPARHEYGRSCPSSSALSRMYSLSGHLMFTSPLGVISFTLYVAIQVTLPPPVVVDLRPNSAAV